MEVLNDMSARFAFSLGGADLVCPEPSSIRSRSVPSGLPDLPPFTGSLPEELLSRLPASIGTTC